VNTCPSFFVKNNKPTKEFITDNLFTEMRYPNNLFIILDVYDIINDQLVLKKTFKIQSDHPLDVNHGDGIQTLGIQWTRNEPWNYPNL
jgi:hypothetical protein